MQQVVDLQKDPGFNALGVELLSISPDPLQAWKSEGAKFEIETPMLSDAEPRNAVAVEYDVMQWQTFSGEPGHTFVLVDTRGRIAWIRDYGAPQNGGVMYVAPKELVPEIEGHLPSN